MAASSSTELPWRSEMRATAALAYPLVLTNLTQALIQTTDIVMLGWVGASTLAAGALGSNLYIAFLVFGIGLVTAASPMMAREIGARRHSVRDVRRTVRQTMWAAVVLALPVWLMLWHAEAILLLFGQQPALAADAAHFVRALQWGFLPALFYLVLRAFVAALERPVWVLIVSASGVLSNALLNYTLIFGKFGLPALGLKGAGIGSAITNTLLFLGMAAVVSIHPRFRRYRLFGRFWRPDWARFAAIWRLGAPIAVTLTLEITIFNAAVFVMGLISVASLAAHAIAIQIAALSFMVPLGIGQATTVRVGLAYGRGDPVGIGRAGWTAFFLGTGFMAMMAVLLVSIPRTLVGAFLHAGDPRNADVVALAISFLGVAALFQIFDGAQAVGAGMLRGLHDTRVPMLYAAFGYWIVAPAVGLTLAFRARWHGLGIWLGLASGLAVVALLMIARWRKRQKLGLMPTQTKAAGTVGGEQAFGPQFTGDMPC